MVPRTQPVDSRPPAPPILARIRAELRALPGRNPAYATEAILQLRDACREAALHCRIGHQHPAADALLDIADAAQALAPIFAPPMAAEAASLARIEGALRRDGAA